MNNVIKNLMIVESPSKCKTISSYLDSNFHVIPTSGHIFELPKSIKSIDVQNNFKIRTVVAPRKKKFLSDIEKNSAKFDNIFLAMDGDREGEGIADSIYPYIVKARHNSTAGIYRIKFYEITKSAILEALTSPGQIDHNLVASFESRRTLDFLIGFYVSPILWKTVGKKLSAGRVQSPGLAMIQERENEIKQFQPENYWVLNISSNLGDLTLKTYQGEKVDSLYFKSEEQAQDACKFLSQLQEYKIQKVLISTKAVNPPTPFNTAALQIAGYNQLGFDTKKTMSVAQTLYENSYISYMRTDSTHISETMTSSIKEYILKNWGKEYVGFKKSFKVKKLHAQEAHEAIRIVSVHHTPDSLKQSLTNEEFKVYKMIWDRSIASQMSSASYSLTTVEIASKDQMNILSTSASYLSFLGWKVLFKDEEANSSQQFYTLAKLKSEDPVYLQEVSHLKKITHPPRKLNQATLIKDLELMGIGRPSSYAHIVETLYKRGYVESNKHQFNITPIGESVIEILKTHFKKYVDYIFTAEIEAQLDKIARGTTSKQEFLNNFWQELKETISRAEKDKIQTKTKTASILLEELCPDCNNPLCMRNNKKGQSFKGCSTYPKCKYTLKKYLDLKCEKCNAPYRVIETHTLPFYACSNYPRCKNHLHKTRAKCPSCGLNLFVVGENNICITCSVQMYEK